MDPAGWIIAVMVGRPSDPLYVEDTLWFHNNIVECHPMFEGSNESQQRAAFPAQAVGISHGMGQAYPVQLQNAKYGDMLQKLLQTREAARIATFQSVNFRPQMRTYKHWDVQNAAFGWCAVTALSRYNHEAGGHLVLWDLGLVLQFPPGSTVLLPSASIALGNVPVADNETRTLFTQYTAGGLLRWVDCGGCSLEELCKEDKQAYQANRDALKLGESLREGIAKFTTMENLLNCGTVKWAESR
ncbi:hypothetical protein PQX77_015736 [Marasmius sp. AFHP31]|nr:hypothetical protein PQX77_015736 [Marasmius sp. AFHP31]